MTVPSVPLCLPRFVAAFHVIGGLLLGLFLTACPASAADPVVSNVTVAQRAGTKLVDISYDLVTDGEVTISVTISGDGGATWTVPATSLTGAVGPGVVAGTGKAIVWDGGADWNGAHTAQGQVQVTATQDAGGDYLVIDLAAGPEATSYPVSYLAAAPEGGWTEEYKTTKLVLRRIPAGTFTMGSPEDELGHLAWVDETQHQVTLTKGLYVGLFEATQKQWERVMGTWPSHLSNAAYRDARPVESVSWNDIRGGSWPGTPAGSGQPAAGTFIQRLRARTGIDFDLPTEAQWEYACRAGTSTALNSGKNLTDRYECPNMADVGRYRYNGGSDYYFASDVNLAFATAAVGSYLPNAWGLYDMHGNVWEWCLDWNAPYPGTVSDPVGSSSGSFRIFRGGAWYDYAEDCRSSVRYGDSPTNRDFFFGFRLSAPASGE